MSQPLFLGIEIGGTKLQLGLGHGDGRLLALERRTIEPNRGATGILAAIGDAALALEGRLGASRERFAAVGIGFGGPVDVARGRVTTSHQISGWDDFPLAEWVRRELGVDTVVIQNDADTAGLAEASFGAGVGVSPILYVTVGSGIGGGLILDGQVYRGAGWGAAEIGHVWINDPSRPPHEREILEHVASGWAIAERARRHCDQPLLHNEKPGRLCLLARENRHAITTQMVARAAQEGDELASLLLDHATTALAEALGHAVTLLAPKRVILGGGVSLMSEELWLMPIRKKLHRNVFPPSRQKYEVVSAMLGEEVVVHGALALARDAAR